MSARFATFLILANVFLALGLLLHYALPPIIDLYIDKQLALQPQSQTFPMWREPPVPIYQRFYFFNVTNAAEIEQFGQKPRLEEVGPFTYRAEWSKRDIQLDAERNTISFKNFKYWHFEPDLSVADQRLQLVTLNAPLAITLTLIQSASNAVRLLVTFSLDGLSDGFFTRRTVKQLLFDGYPDLLTTFGPLLNAEMLSQGGHFGYMNARNGSLDGAYEINTGLDDIRKLNTINKFNGRSKLAYWSHHSPAGHHARHAADGAGSGSGPAARAPAARRHQHHSCNSLEGATIGELFPPAREEPPAEAPHAPQSIRMFQPDFCRVWRLDYESQSELASGLRLRRFRATRDIFRNATDLPENSCFFPGRRAPAAAAAPAHQANQVPHRTGRQRQQRQQQQQQQQHAAPARHGHGRVRLEWPAGVFSLAPCKFNAPIYMSMPHFLDADAHFGAQVEGLAPDPERHEFFVDLEPRTGSPVQLSARVQLNVAISKPPGLVRFRNVPEIMFPVFWQELSVNLTGTPVIDQLLLASRGAQEANTRVSYSFLILGMAILVTSGVFYLHARLQDSAGAGDLPDGQAEAKDQPVKEAPAPPAGQPKLADNLSEIKSQQ